MQNPRLIVCLVFFLPINLGLQSSQQNGEKPTLQQLVNATKQYFRDSTEIPLEQDATYQVSDPSGRVRKTAGVSVEYVFKGYNRRAGTYPGEVMKVESFAQVVPSIEAVRAVVNSDASWLMAVSVLSDQAIQKNLGVAYTMGFEETDDPDRPVTVVLTPNAPCPPLTMEQQPDYYAIDVHCGPLKLQLAKDLSLQSFTFDAHGLPAQVKIKPFDRTTLLRYKIEAEFHEVMLPHDSQPLVIPNRVTTTLETAKGKIVITSVYLPHPASIVH